MDDKRQPPKDGVEAEREKGAALEYDDADEEALTNDRPAPTAGEGTQE